jgi:hypothetical protein
MSANWFESLLHVIGNPRVSMRWASTVITDYSAQKVEVVLRKCAQESDIPCKFLDFVKLGVLVIKHSEGQQNSTC